MITRCYREWIEDTRSNESPYYDVGSKCEEYSFFITKESVMKKFGLVEWIAFILIIIGGLNWGLVGLFNFDVVAVFFGQSIIAKAIYILIGIAAVYKLYYAFKTRNEA